MNNNRGLGFLSGLALGGIAGAAAVLLMAPKSGQETREDIRSRGIELKDRGQALGNKAGDQVRKAKEEGYKRVSDAQDRAGIVLDEQKARMGDAMDAGRQAASERKEELLARLQAG